MRILLAPVTVICIVLCITASLVSCSKDELAKDIALPSTPPLSRSAIGYGVISTSYIHIQSKRGGDSDNKAGASNAANTVGILRKGSIVEILERRPLMSSGRAESWVLASPIYDDSSSTGYSGWLRENELRVYDSLVQAKTAAGILLQ